MILNPRRYSVCLLFLVFCLNAFAFGQAYSLTDLNGRVRDLDGKPVPGATVSLLGSRDSTLLQTTLTIDSGTYCLEALVPGIYLLKISATAYRTVIVRQLDVSPERSVNSIPDVILTPASRQLREVSIRANRPAIIQKRDRTVINVDNSILSAGNTALDIIAHAPGITVRENGEILLNGKSGITVTIDGKPTYLQAGQLNEMLRSTDGTLIHSVEVISRPDAGTDASGNAGIINISMKKNNENGTNGSLTLGAGYGLHPKQSETLVLNHRQGSLNIFGSFSHSDSKNEFRMQQERGISDTAGVHTFYRQHSSSVRTSHNSSYRLGADLITGKRNTLGFLTSGNMNTAGSQGNSLTDIGMQPGIFNSSQDQLSKKHMHNVNFSINLNDRLKLDTLGQELAFDLDYAGYHDQAAYQYQTNFTNLDGSAAAPALFFRQQTPTQIYIRSVKADYTLPAGRNIKLTTGFKYSNVRTDNRLDAQKLENGVYLNDTSLTNRFIYNEKIAAAYFDLKSGIRHTSFEAGLRAEQTNSDGNLVNSAMEIKRSYLSLFPNFSVVRQINPHNELSIAYNRRIDRPGYENLNPFIYYIDQFAYTQGNPFLKPQYTDKVTFSYSHNQNLNLELAYSRTSGYMAFLPLVNAETRQTEYTTINMQRQNYWSLTMNSPYTITNWWTGNVTAAAFYSNFRSDKLLNGEYERGLLSAHLQSTQFLAIAETWKGEISGNYDAPLVDGGYHYLHNTYADAGLSHTIMHQRATLKFSVSDLFNSNRVGMFSNYQTNDINVRLKSESRVARLTFSYNFGDSKIRVRRRNGGAEDEKARVSG